eukprot:g52449.t1
MSFRDVACLYSVRMLLACALGVAAAVGLVFATLLRPLPNLRGDDSTLTAPSNSLPCVLRILTINCWCHYLATPMGQYRGVTGAAAPVMNGFLGQNSGCAIFSRYPLHHLRSHIFKHSAEQANNKGLAAASLYVKHQTSDAVQEVSLISTHFDARTWPPKQAEINELVDFIRQRRQEKRTSIDVSSHSTFLVAGDFNLAPQPYWDGGYDDGSGYQVLAKAMQGVQLQSVFGHPPKCQPTEGGCTLDHIFISPHDWQSVTAMHNSGVVRYTDAHGRSVSDHLGVAVTLIS